jgi:hypothetical protein
MMIRVDDIPIVPRDKFRDLKHQSSPVRATYEEYCGRFSGHRISAGCWGNLRRIRIPSLWPKPDGAGQFKFTFAFTWDQFRFSKRQGLISQPEWF